MAVRARVQRDAYVDSVKLMQVARALRARAGVVAADAVMATAANVNTLAGAGLLPPEAAGAGPNDLLLCVRAEDEAAAEAALEEAVALLRGRAKDLAPGEARPRSLRAANVAAPGANLAVVSVPGGYAALEAEEALRAGLHVFLFSDNVSVEDEVRLKALADEGDLLVMGPDCGTAILGGVGLGFANAVQRGPVGIVGASGTGIQQVSCLLDAAGVGVSHAIGTGGRDLAEAVGGRTTLRALRLLAEDPGTRAIVLISKPPAPAVAERVLAAAMATGKPVVACLLGADGVGARAGVAVAGTLAEAADAVVGLVAPDGRAGGEAAGAAQGIAGSEAAGAARGVVGGQGPGRDTAAGQERVSAAGRAQRQPLPAPHGERASGGGAGGGVRGLFAGGTLAQEALLVLRGQLGAVRSNLDGSAGGDGQHCVMDFGSDEYTVGRPHPMIDNALRLEHLAAAARDPAVGVVLLDVILGYGAHADPAGELGPAIEQAIAAARDGGRVLSVVVSLCGADGDPQGLVEQRARLEAAGAQVYRRNVDAAAAAAALAQGAQSGVVGGAGGSA